MKVELIYDIGCPNVAAARARLREAFASVGLTPQWHEWKRADDGAPEYVHGYGSPTILVDGRDIASDAPVAGESACRLYADRAGKLSGSPALHDLQAAFRKANFTGLAPIESVKQTMPTLPAVGLALLPKLTCAACWPAYAALLSSLGIGFVDYTPYLLPLTTAFLVITLWMLVYRVANRRGYAPFALGAVASVVVLVGKFKLDSDLALYGGITLLVGASLWNAWPTDARATCDTCAAEHAQASRRPILCDHRAS